MKINEENKKMLGECLEWEERRKDKRKGGKVVAGEKRGEERRREGRRGQKGRKAN